MQAEQPQQWLLQLKQFVAGGTVATALQKHGSGLVEAWSKLAPAQTAAETAAASASAAAAAAGVGEAEAWLDPDTAAAAADKSCSH